MRKIIGTMAAVLAAGALAGFATAGIGDGSQTYQATVDPAQLRGASAELRVEDGDATLVAEGLPEPVGAYQAWIKRSGVASPRALGPLRENNPMDLEFGPTGALYSLGYGEGFFVENEDAQVARIDTGESQEFFVAAGAHLRGVHSHQDTNRHTSADTRLILASTHGASDPHEFELAA
jgi:hypothetical protein